MCEQANDKPRALLWYLIAAKQQNKFNDPTSKNMFASLGVPYPSDRQLFPSHHYIGCIWITCYTEAKNVLLSLDQHQRRWARSLIKPKRGREASKTKKNVKKTSKPTIYFAYKINRRLFFDRKTLLNCRSMKNGENIPSCMSKSHLPKIYHLYPEICEINEKHYSVVQERSLVVLSLIHI